MRIPRGQMAHLCAHHCVVANLTRFIKVELMNDTALKPEATDEAILAAIIVASATLASSFLDNARRVRKSSRLFSVSRLLQA